MKSILFIPARKGSTGIKGKNLVNLNGLPLIHYTLKICKKFSKDHIVFVSTDSKKIKNYTKKFGYFNKYLRPKKLASSKSNVVDSIIHGVEWLKKERDIEIKDIILLQPTSPLRKLSDLMKAYKIYKNKKLKSLTSVTKVRENSLGHIKIKRNSQNWNFLYKSKKKILRRQDYPKDHYLLNGAFYFTDYETLKKRKTLVTENLTHLYETERFSSVDIDFKSDLKLAELIIKQYYGKKKY